MSNDVMEKIGRSLYGENWRERLAPEESKPAQRVKPRCLPIRKSRRTDPVLMESADFEFTVDLSHRRLKFFLAERIAREFDWNFDRVQIFREDDDDHDRGQETPVTLSNLQVSLMEAIDLADEDIYARIEREVPDFVALTREPVYRAEYDADQDRFVVYAIKFVLGKKRREKYVPRIIQERYRTYEREPRPEVTELERLGNEIWDFPQERGRLKQKVLRSRDVEYDIDIRHPKVRILAVRMLLDTFQRDLHFVMNDEMVDTLEIESGYLEARNECLRDLRAQMIKGGYLAAGEPVATTVFHEDRNVLVMSVKVCVAEPATGTTRLAVQMAAAKRKSDEP